MFSAPETESTPGDPGTGSLHPATQQEDGTPMGPCTTTSVQCKVARFSPLVYFYHQI